MSEELVQRLRGRYKVGVNEEFGSRDFSKFIPPICIEAANRIEELEKLCAEAYQVMGILADEAGRFGDEDVDAVLTALADQKYTVELLPFKAKDNSL